MPHPPAAGYVPVDGVEVYWESRGEGGPPLVLVHGGYGLTSEFGGLLETWAQRRQVVALELQGHGHTRDVDRPFSFEAFGDQIGGVIEGLGLGPADLFGFSLGAHASLRCAVQHGPLVRRLVLGSIPCRRDGWFPEVLAAFDQMSSAGFEFMRQSPLFDAWSRVAPDPDSFPTLMDKTGELLRRPFDWRDDARAITAPTLLVYGDCDSIPPAGAAEFFAVLGGGLVEPGWDGSLPTTARLAVLPGTTHYTVLQSPLLAEVVSRFLDG